MSVAYDIIKVQIDAAIKNVKHKREKDENQKFMDDAVKVLLLSYWPDSFEFEAEKETVLQTHMNSFDFQ